MKALLVTGLAASMFALPAVANEYEPAMRAYFDSEIVGILNDPIFVDAINSQNSTTMAYDQSRIDELDLMWRAEVGTDNSATIAPVLENAAADRLRAIVEGSGGRITEIFVMDGMGLNVAASATTSDYWQGDEAKFTETHGSGSGAVHFGEVEFDESSQRYQGQISVTISDPATGAAIGAMTVGVDAESLL